jgi:hypothetical protein
MRETMRSKQSSPSAVESDHGKDDPKKDKDKKKVARIFSPVKIKIAS